MSNLDENKISTSNEDFLKDVVSSEKKSSEDKAEEPKKKKDKKEGSKEKKKFSRIKMKHSAMSTVLTIAFFVILVLVNVVATKLFDRYPITLDLTSDNLYSISEETEEYIKDIDVDVMITVCADEASFSALSTYTQQANEVMKTYSKYNSHIQYQYKPIDSNPDFYADYTDDVQTYDIIVETNPVGDDGETVKRTRIVSLIDLLEFTDELVEQFSNYGTTVEAYAAQMGSDLTFLNYYGNYIESSNAEQAFTSAVMAVTDPEPVIVTMLTGREELDELSYFQTLLTANGYTVNTIDITTEEIPEDTDVVVISAPKVDYLAEDIAKVNTFLTNDGNLGKQLIYVASTGQGDTPNLNEFLAEYGLEIGDGAVCETYSGNYYQQPYYTITSNIEDNFLQDMSSADPQLLILGSRPINRLFEEDGMIVTDAYVTSTENAYTMDIESGDSLSKGQQNYLVVASKAAFTDDNQTLYSNIIAIGSNSMISDQVLAYNQYQNREYILSVLNGLTGKTEGITITPKVISGNIFDINDAQKSILKWTFILIIPGIVLVTCLVIWIRRKNR